MYSKLETPSGSNFTCCGRGAVTVMPLSLNKLLRLVAFGLQTRIVEHAPLGATISSYLNRSCTSRAPWAPSTRSSSNDLVRRTLTTMLSSMVFSRVPTARALKSPSSAVLGKTNSRFLFTLPFHDQRVPSLFSVVSAYDLSATFLSVWKGVLCAFCRAEADIS